MGKKTMKSHPSVINLPVIGISAVFINQLTLLYPYITVKQKLKFDLIIQDFTLHSLYRTLAFFYKLILKF